MASRGRKDNLKFAGAAALASAVWAVTPLSWLVVALGINGRFPRSGIVWWYSVCEVIFSVYLKLLSRRVQERLTPPEVDIKTLDALLDRCLGKSGQADGEVLATRMRRWFHGAELKDIGADNVREWLAWAFGGTDLEACQKDPQRRELVEKGLSMVQQRLNTKFNPGYNARCKSMRLTLDPVKTIHRPFGYYVVCNGVSALTIAWIVHRHGFQRQQHGACEFLVLPAKEKSSTQHPILLLHGLGIGLGQYVAFLKHLVHHRYGVAILVQPHISVNIWHPGYLDAPNKWEHVEAVRECFAANKFEKTTILSHSNGTMVHGWLSRDAPEICHRHLLVDPVCFRLWEGATCYAFLAKSWSSGIEILLGYFVARELGVSYAICRKFQWWDMLFWIDDLDSVEADRLHIVMGGNDVLIDVEASVEYLHASGVADTNITVIPGAQHGQALFMPSSGMQAVCKLLSLP